MKIVQKFCIVMISIGAVACFAETFVEEKPQRRMNVGQLRQDVIHEMAILIEKQSALIQKEAQIQQLLCGHVRAYAESEKNSMVSCASMADLKKLLKVLQDETVRHDKELIAATKLITDLKALERK